MAGNQMWGVILAGGQNRRMNGRMKALLPFHGEALIARQIRTMKRVCDEIVVVTRDAAMLEGILDNTIHLLEDRIPGKGPLSGMHAALTYCGRGDVWIVACDMPFVSGEAAHLLRKHKERTHCDAVIPRMAGHLHPLHGVYGIACLEAVCASLRTKSYRLMAMFQQLDWTSIEESFFLKRGINPHFTMNVNTPADYFKALSVI